MKLVDAFAQILSQVFFPRSITQESGYKAKILSPQISGKIPIPTPLPDYYGPDVPGSPTSAVRMGAFRYPADDSQIHPIYVTESQAGQSRHSAESTSPGYESDAESFAMASSTIPSPHLIDYHPPKNRSHPQYRHDSSQTAASRPTSGGRSDDTVWERQDDSLPHTKRRRSDGPFVYSRHRSIIAVIPGSVPVSEEGHRSTDHERETGSSQLHPYVSTVWPLMID